MNAEVPAIEIVMADSEQALTLARFVAGGKQRLLAVTAWKSGALEGVDLTAAFGGNDADAPALFVAQGYDAIRDRVAATPLSGRIRVAESELRLPVDFTDRHIAVGTNYPEHADDSGTTRPFLFPKIVQPGLSGDSVSVHGGLLDYEVEVAVLPLEDVTKEKPPRFLGLMVANDFTDRETLMRAVDRRDIESGKGFTTGKSFPGYLPVGPVLVIPRDYRTFVPRIDLRLFVNGELRQDSPASKMVWDVDAIIAQSLAREGVVWDHLGGQVPLFAGDAIPARTLILTGTPRGTVFAGLPAGVMARGLLHWLAGGWDKDLPTRVIDAYGAAAREQKSYLQPGDEVRTEAAGLGRILSSVVP